MTAGLTGGCRQLSVTDRDEALRSAVELQAEFDTYPWLVKCTSVEQIRRCKKEGLKAGIVTSQEAEGYSKDLKLLELLYNYGLRVQQLSYNNQNLIGAGCMEPNGGAGLSKFGYPVCGKVQRAWYRGRYRTLRLSYHDGCLQVQQGACHRIPYRRGEGQLPRTLQE